MMDAYGTYLALMSRFLAHELTASEFQYAFLQQFKHETRPIDAAMFELLDELFGDIDSYTADQTLLAEAPGFYLDEAGLRLKVEEILQRMKAQVLHDPA